MTPENNSGCCCICSSPGQPNRWGRTKKLQLLAKLERLEKQGQFLLPGFDKGIQA
ncbi:conserved hypothetical protein [Escherichia coli M605]|uniref:Uncharacterized protein n=1 Tax=Escherichia coli M605 TaxID=656417 RepID=F4T748_ECOLX|nr:conserved hypothetical protein [Escherichia coli M605]